MKRPGHAKVPGNEEPSTPFVHSMTAIISRAPSRAHKETVRGVSMALAHAIAEHLPYLRRYARALCGTQKSGDAYVRACLEAIVADTSVLESRLSPRVGLYRLFHTLWNSAHVDVPATALKRGVDGVERRLSELTPARR